MPVRRQRSRRTVVLWKVAIYGSVAAALTLTFWLDPLHDDTGRQALILGPISGLLVAGMIEVGPKVLAAVFGRDVLGGGWK
jgi:hypothetical protein